MTNKYAVNQAKSDTVSGKLQRIVRLMQLGQYKVAYQEVDVLMDELRASDIVTITATVETKKG